MPEADVDRGLHGQLGPHGAPPLVQAGLVLAGLEAFPQSATCDAPETGSLSSGMPESGSIVLPGAIVNVGALRVIQEYLFHN